MIFFISAALSKPCILYIFLTTFLLPITEQVANRSIIDADSSAGVARKGYIIIIQLQHIYRFIFLSNQLISGFSMVTGWERVQNLVYSNYEKQIFSFLRPIVQFYIQIEHFLTTRTDLSDAGVRVNDSSMLIVLCFQYKLCLQYPTAFHSFYTNQILQFFNSKISQLKGGGVLMGQF